MPQKPATLLKKRLWHWCFPVNFGKFFTTPFLQNTSGDCLWSVKCSGWEIENMNSQIPKLFMRGYVYSKLQTLSLLYIWTLILLSKDKKIMRQNCPYSELFWSVFSRIWTESGEIWCISPYSVKMRENTEQNNSEYGQIFTQWKSALLWRINVG